MSGVHQRAVCAITGVSSKSTGIFCKSLSRERFLYFAQIASEAAGGSFKIGKNCEIV